MSFTAKKLTLDLTLDLTAYIPKEDGGILTCEISCDEMAQKLKEWQLMCISEGEAILKLNKQYTEDKGNVSLTEITSKSTDSAIKQIDYFYNKGAKFYDKIPHPVFKDIIEYLNGQISPVKKK